MSESPNANPEPRVWERVYGFFFKWFLFILVVGGTLLALRSVGAILQSPSQRTLLYHALELPCAILSAAVLLFWLASRTKVFRLLSVAINKKRVFRFFVFFPLLFGAWMLISSVIHAFTIASGGRGQSFSERMTIAIIWSLGMALWNAKALHIGSQPEEGNK